MGIYHEITNLNGPVGYRIVQGIPGLTIQMENHWNPWSIKEAEFEYLKNLIINNNLQNGYELATAFGISSLAIGLGFKETGGKLVTMDAYIEESYGDGWKYKNQPKLIYENSDGYKSVNFLINHYNLNDVVFPEIGWSPDDTASVITKHIDKKLDFVFIDGGHFDYQIKKDIESVIPFLGEEYILSFHDTDGSLFTNEINNLLMEVTGKVPTIVVPPDAGFNLSIIDNKTKK